MKFIFLVIYILLLCGTVYRMIKTNKIHKKRLKMLKEYHNFSMQVFDWIKEIKNTDKVNEVLSYHIDEIFSSSPEDRLRKWEKISEFKNYIVEHWGQYIPSLKQQIRDEKIDSILDK
jgi:late competence protein required for DNA uptake (superfamily II DNA/RNA helicase)